MVKKEEVTKGVGKSLSTSDEVSSKRKVVKKPVLDLSKENVGFKAGDVYQALASEQKALSVAQIAKVAGISKEEALLGLGWLYKEGKIRNEGSNIVLA